MSTLIDQRISIPAMPDAVWSIIADQNQLPKWRTDCQQVSILTTRQFGVGTRRRVVSPRGKDKVEEITAWYEGLGYEYALIESRQYKLWVGRVRLQAVPEGTIVQWTINYEPRGLLGALRHLLGRKNKLEQQSAESLRKLYQYLKSMGYKPNDAPQRKQPIKEVKQIVRESSQQIAIPVLESVADTKPRRPAGLDDAIQEQQHAQQNETAKAPQAQTTDAPVTQPKPPPGLRDTPSKPQVSPIETPAPESDQPSSLPKTPAEPETNTPSMDAPLEAPTPPRSTPRVDLSKMRYADEVAFDAAPPTSEEKADANKPAKSDPTVAASPTTDAPSEDDPIRHQQEMPPISAAKATLPTTSPQDVPPSTHETGEVSIWEAFGVKPPSQLDAEALDQVVKIATSEHEAVAVPTDSAPIPTPTPPSTPTAHIEDPPTSTKDALQHTDIIQPIEDMRDFVLRIRPVWDKTGLRLSQARQQANLRAPGQPDKSS